MEKHDIRSDIVFVDEKTKIGKFEWPSINDIETKMIEEKIQDHLRDYYYYCRRTKDGVSNPLTDLLIVGGDNIIPFHRYWYKPSIDHPADKDNMIYSDAPYGSSRKDVPNFAWAVGRFPDDPQKPNLLLEEIRTATRFHNSVDVSPSQDSGLCCSMKICNRISEKIYGNVNPNIKILDQNPLVIVGKRLQQLLLEEVLKINHLAVSSPPNEQLEAKHITSRIFHYYNLHGSKGGDIWAGEDEDGVQGVALQLNTLDSQDSKVEGSVVVSTACYGANVVDMNSNNSWALKFLEKGARCFVGSTMVSYGWRPPKDDTMDTAHPDAGDIIADKFLRLVVKEREQFGQALRRAKKEYLNEVFESRRTFDRFDFKTLTEFVLYGDPTLK
jgi:hypothetical protein